MAASSNSGLACNYLDALQLLRQRVAAYDCVVGVKMPLSSLHTYSLYVLDVFQLLPHPLQPVLPLDDLYRTFFLGSFEFLQTRTQSQKRFSEYKPWSTQSGLTHPPSPSQTSSPESMIFLKPKPNTPPRSAG